MPELSPWTLLTPWVPLHVVSGVTLLASPISPRSDEVRVIQVTARNLYGNASIRSGILGADEPPRATSAPSHLPLNEVCAQKFGQRVDHVLTVPGVAWSQRTGLFGPRTPTAVSRDDDAAEHFDPYHLVERIRSLPIPDGATPRPATEPASEAARARVDAVKASYGELASDIAYRIESSALFDPSAPPTRHYQLLMLRWEDGSGRLGAEDVERLAVEISLAFDTARRHAETVGLAHLPATARADAGRAVKAARLAVNASTPGEREAAMAQVQRLLGAIALYYLPPEAEVPRMIGGAHVQLGSGT